MAASWGLRILRVLVSAALVASGGLMVAASRERWGAGCPWGIGQDARSCELVQDHLYDFLPPTEPWEPIGDAARLGGLSLAVLAVVLLPLVWALAGRRPRAFALLLIGAVTAALATASIAAAAWLSGERGEVVVPFSTGTALFGWLVVLAAVYVWLAVVSTGWSRAAAVLLVLSSPLVASFTYALGPFDAQPWWEAVSGTLVGVAGLCVLVAAVLPGRQSRAAVRTRPATPVDVL